MRLGDILVQEKLATPEQVENAVRIAKERSAQTGKQVLMGDILVEQKIITKFELLEMLSIQGQAMEIISLRNYPLDTALINAIPEQVLMTYKMIPLKLSGNALVVATSRPKDTESLNQFSIDVAAYLGTSQIVPKLAHEQDIEDVLIRLFKATKLVQKVSEDNAGTARQRATIYGKEADDDGPVVQLVNAMLNQAISDRASDIHIKPVQEGDRRFLRVQFRVDGMLKTYSDFDDPGYELSHAIVNRLMIMAEMDIGTKKVPQDGRFSFNYKSVKIDTRTSTLPTVLEVPSFVIRLHKSVADYSLQNMEFYQLSRYRRIFKTPYGIILVTGPTGSGKTTTLYATINELNTTENSIITLEDPVENILSNVTQIPINVKAGITFASGLRSIMRHDPDIIMVGETRDDETADAAIQAAITGHLVFSSLHSFDVVSAMTRMMQFDVDKFQIVSAVIGVVNQRLVRRLCSCAIPAEVTINGERLFVRKPKDGGCYKCNQSGYNGSLALHELLEPSPQFKKMLMNGQHSDDELREEAVKSGTILLQDDGLLKVKKGLTSLEELIRVTGNIKGYEPIGGE